MNRIWPPDDEPPPYGEGYGEHKQLPIQYRHRNGPLMTAYHETLITDEGIVLASIGGQTKLEAAAVDVALALIHTEAVTLPDLLKDPGLQIRLGQAATRIALSVLATAEQAGPHKPGDQGK